jgi:hypothetical protein
MSDERDETIGETDDNPIASTPDDATGEASPNEPPPAERPARTSDDFLVPGPTPESNAGLARWGLTWLAFSLLLILLMLCVSFACLTLAQVTGFA